MNIIRLWYILELTTWWNVNALIVPTHRFTNQVVKLGVDNPLFTWIKMNIPAIKSKIPAMIPKIADMLMILLFCCYYFRFFLFGFFLSLFGKEGVTIYRDGRFISHKSSVSSIFSSPAPFLPSFAGQAPEHILVTKL